MKQRPTSTGRRGFLQGTVALTGAAVATSGPARAAGSLEIAASATAVLHDPKLTLDAGVRTRLESSGARFIALTSDPVRQWRGPLAGLLAHPGTRLYGVTRWPDFLIIRGLAAETRRRVRHESFDPATGVMTWLIA